MKRIEVKPLSVNDVWKGKRYKTDAYKAFERKLMLILPKKIDLPEPPFEIHLRWGFSCSSSDWDNPIKPFQDVLQKKYKFNDKLIKKGIVEAVSVPKGQEFIEFNIIHFEEK
jgi:hypothetical protein